MTDISNRCINRILEIENGTVNSYLGNYEKYKQLKHKAQTTDRLNHKGKTETTEPLKANLDTNNDNKAKLIEAEIIEIEDEIKKLELSFNSETDHKEYVHYQKLTNRLNEEYAKWEKTH